MALAKRLLLWSVAVLLFCLALPVDCPAPLVWRKGEGWTYERGGVTTGKTPREQLDIAERYQKQKKYDEAVVAYRRLIARWPTSFAAQDARLGMAECLSALGYYYKAFKEYQTLIEKHPDTDHFQTVLQRQYQIGNLFLAGEKHKVWRLRIFSGIDKAAEVFSQVVKNGPYSLVGPSAQFRIGLVYEKQKDYISAVHAYEKLLERYPNHALAEAAQFQIGWAYKQEAGRSEYDQNSANQAIAALNDYLLRYPNGEKVPLARDYLTALKQEQSKGLFRVAQFYEKQKNVKAALIYYNEVIEQNPRSDWANSAQRKIALLSPSITGSTTANP
jgi:outer membrane protein assembly factor BamD